MLLRCVAASGFVHLCSPPPLQCVSTVGWSSNAFARLDETVYLIGERRRLVPIGDDASGSLRLCATSRPFAEYSRIGARGRQSEQPSFEMVSVARAAYAEHGID